MSSQERISLVIPVLNENSRPGASLPERLTELDIFWARFPLEIECVFVIDPSPDGSYDVIENFTPKKLKVRAHQNFTHLGRARSVTLGIQKSSGNFVIVYPLDFAVPLAELYTFLQHLLGNDSADIAFGDRTTPKKPASGTKSKWQQVLADIVLEKSIRAGLPFKDPTCSLVAAKREVFLALLDSKSPTSWYFAKDLFSEAQKTKTATAQLPILYRDDGRSSIPLIREFLRNLF